MTKWAGKEHPSLLSQLSLDTGWRAPESLPELDDRFKRIGFDYETDGIDWAGGSQPIGAALALEDGRAFYLPWGHRGGGNLDRALCVRWLRENLRGKTLCLAEGKFEVHMSRSIDLDLESMECRLREAQYKAALLAEDDSRQSFKLDDLMQKFLGRSKKEIVRGHIYELPAYEVGPYAIEDARGHLDLDTELTRRINQEDLGRVSDLEDSLIYAVCEMEKNGARLDVAKLQTWHREINRRVAETILAVHRATGLRINPNSAKDLERLFKHLGLPYSTTETGLGSFTNAFLKGVDHSLVQDVRRVRQYSSLDSKYFAKYLRSLDPHGIIRFKLHQLKGDEFGTISGRFSASGYDRSRGFNPQQVYDDERQMENVPETADMLVREVFVPDQGLVWGKADASQIEFRLMADFSKSPALINAYRENPWVDFHDAVANLLKVGRKKGKGLNFGFIYAMGRGKLAKQLGVSQAEADELYDSYNSMFPEVKPLIYKAIERARERGFVVTRLGRKARFNESNENRIHSALNRVIQGTAADIMKLKIREVYSNRKQLGIHKMRLTVHDELDCDFESHEHVHGPFAELLNEQLSEIPTQVPILWDTKSGPNWARLGKLKDAQDVDTRSPNRWKNA